MEKPAIIKFDGKEFPFTTERAASEMFVAAREEHAIRTGLGASDMPTMWILTATRKIWGHVSYNGRVWDTHPNDWRENLNRKPVFDPASPFAQ